MSLDRRPSFILGPGGRHGWRVLEEGSGTVLAVFERCVYLRGAHGLCCLTLPELPAGPLNVRLDPVVVAGVPSTTIDVVRWPLSMRIGAEWMLDSDGLRIGPAHAQPLAGSPPGGPPCRWRPPSVTLPHIRSLQDGYAVLVHLLDQPSARAVASDVEAMSGADARFERRLRRGILALRGWLCRAVDCSRLDPPEEIGVLLGCGPGLTPSGDDVLVGALVSLWMLGLDTCATRLAGLVRRLASRHTGLISQAHLHAACAGEGIEPLHRLIEAISGPHPYAIRSALERLRAHGHRSGVDSLRGVQVVFDVVARPVAS
ncbi:MAG: DUF2877 domain-containing protein [Gammaproteobacteria bacterium]|nr:DUF2877 domain-containing protein [Gammaproteobacteria bacterium]